MLQGVPHNHQYISQKFHFYFATHLLRNCPHSVFLGDFIYEIGSGFSVWLNNIFALPLLASGLLHVCSVPLREYKRDVVPTPTLIQCHIKPPEF
jgi:hypothetical protein